MTIVSALRLFFLGIATMWLALAGVIVPKLFAADADVAAWHVLILSAIALATIVFLTKPNAPTTKARKP